MSLQSQTFVIAFPPLEESTARIGILDESIDFQPFEPTTGVIPLDKDIPEGIFREAAEHINLHAAFQRSDKSTARGVLLGSSSLSFNIEPYNTSDLTVKKIVGFYENLLAIKESEIRKLRNELSELKKESEQMDGTLEQIKDQYKEKIAKIPEVQQVLCKQNHGELQFVVALNDMTRDLSDQLDDVEDYLENNYTGWIFDFEYVGHRVSSQQFQQTYIQLFTRD